MIPRCKLMEGLLLFTLVVLPCLYIHHLYNNETTIFIPAYVQQDESGRHEIPSNNASVKLLRGMHRGRPTVNDFSWDPKCTMALNSRFDCARDKAVSKSECEQRGCCYAPVLHSTGPPWCFYPSLYRGYRMGPLTPTSQGQTATLTRAAPSYLPRDISVLELHVTKEATDCLHITVSINTVSEIIFALPCKV